MASGPQLSRSRQVSRFGASKESASRRSSRSPNLPPSTAPCSGPKAQSASFGLRALALATRRSTGRSRSRSRGTTRRSRACRPQPCTATRSASCGWTSAPRASQGIRLSNGSLRRATSRRSSSTQSLVLRIRARRNYDSGRAPSRGTLVCELVRACARPMR
eukprot:Amastigsp_a508346_21.p4 type:complete len:161 gc:universal Amastigsp_a508346_21:1146-1628(+)